MQTHSVTSNQDGGAGEFSLQGACKTPDNADVRRGCAAGCLQDNKLLGTCKTGRFLEAGKR